MMDITDPEHPVQAGIVNLGANTGPHNVMLTHDDKRLVVTDYFLNEDNFGKIHFEGDHQVHVIKDQRGIKGDQRGQTGSFPIFSSHSQTPFARSNSRSTLNFDHSLHNN
jgi:hypothetical protein